MKKRFSCESFLDFKFVSDPQLSPDGMHTAFIVKKADIKNNTYQSMLYLLQNETGDIRQMGSDESIAAYCWETEKSILFPNSTDYCSLNIEDGTVTRKFSLPVKSEKLLPAGDGIYVLTASFDADAPSPDGLSEEEYKLELEKYKNRGYQHITEIPFTSNGAGFVNRKRKRIYLYNSKTEELTPITGPMFQTADIKVKNGKVLYIGQEFTDIKSLKNGVYIYDIKADSHICLLEPEHFLVKGFELYEDMAVLNLTDGASYGNGENGDFYTVNIHTKELRLLSPHRHHCIGNTVTSDVKLGAGQTTVIDGDCLYYTSTVDMDCIIEKLNLHTGEQTRLTGAGSVDFLDVKDGQLVCTAFRGCRLPEIYTCNADASTVEENLLAQRTHFNDFFEKEYEISVPEYIECHGSAPWPIQGYVIKPAGYEPGKKYPGILAIHGGPRLTYGPVFMHQMQLFASSGYFVFFCNPRGSEGRGNEFGDIRKRFGDIDFSDFMEFTDTVLGHYPDIDPARLAVEGGSYGGFMTNWIIGHTDRFAAACSQRSIANWTGMEGTTDIGYYFCKGQTGASHMEDHALQWKQSPLASADKCTTPTLFIHGEKDYRCYMQEAFQMFSALKRSGCPAKLCLFQGENHELSRSGRPKQRLRRLEEMLEWFDTYVSLNAGSQKSCSEEVCVTERTGEYKEKGV